MSRERRTFSPEDKVSLLRRHLLDKTAISVLCAEADITPTQFYQWQKQFFENGGAAFKNSDRAALRIDSAKDRQIDVLKAKIQTKNEVLSELLEEHVQLKKALGEP